MLTSTGNSVPSFALCLPSTPELLLLHLQHMRSHGMEPGYISLLHFAELVMLWERLSGGWEPLQQLAQGWRLQHLLALGLLVLGSLPLKAPPPAAASCFTHGGPLAALQRRVWWGLLALIRRQPPVVNQVQGLESDRLDASRRQLLRYALRLTSHDRWRDVARSQRHYARRLGAWWREGGDRDE